MAVTLSLAQSGSGDSEIHAEPGDTLTFLVLPGVQGNALAWSLANLQALSEITGIDYATSFGLDSYEDGNYILAITQSGSGTNTINLVKGDTVSLELASVIKNSVLAAAVTALQALGNVSGVTFAVNAAGEAD